MKFWIYIEKELSDLQTGFEKIFGVNNLYRDYENVWEWIESIDRESYVYLNISRPHNWKKGEYQKPIMIILKSNKIELNEVDIALKIRKQLNCDVYAGEIHADRNNNPVIGENRKY